VGGHRLERKERRVNKTSLKFSLAVIAAGAFAAFPASAHHSFAASYFEEQKITVEGKISAFLYRNPHSYVEMESTDAQGATTKWIAEWFGSGRLSRVGVEQDTFKPGDQVVITGAPGRDTNEHRVHLKTILRPSDGYKFDQMQRYGGGRQR
jgi:hypothetical protein